MAGGSRNGFACQGRFDVSVAFAQLGLDSLGVVEDHQCSGGMARSRFVSSTIIPISTRSLFTSPLKRLQSCGASTERTTTTAT